MKYFIDLTGAEKPPGWRSGDPLLIPIEKGKHSKEWDIIESRLPKQMVQRLRSANEKIEPVDELAKSRPIGTTTERIKARGAKIIREPAHR